MKRSVVLMIVFFTVMITGCGKDVGAKSTNSSAVPLKTGKAAAIDFKTLYVYAKSGLNIRKTPSLTAETVTKVPFGSKLELLDDNKTPVQLTYEGLMGVWKPVKYGTDHGYAFEGFFGVFPVPQYGISVKEYFTKNYGPFEKVVTNKYNVSKSEDYGWDIECYFKCGVKMRLTADGFGTEDTITLPGMTIQQAFVFLKLFDLPLLKELTFPQKNGVKTIPSGDELTITVVTGADGIESLLFKVQKSVSSEMSLSWIKLGKTDDGTVSVSFGNGV